MREAVKRRSAIVGPAGAALVLVALLGWSASPAPAAFPGANGRIAFDSDRGPGGDADIFTMTAAGNDETPLTGDPGSDSYGAYSPDASRIAFVSDRDGDDEIFVMHADGTHERQLTHNSRIDFFPSFTPNGRRILFDRGADVNSEIFVMKRDGSNQRALTDNHAADFAPVMSVLGRIAFERGVNGTDQIITMRADGSHRRQITHSDGFIGARNPDFSPNGRKIVFADDRSGNYQVWMMRASGRNQTQVTFTAEEEQEPVFSPNGHRIAFGAQEPLADFEIFSARVDGGDRTPLTANDAYEEAADWGVAGG